MAISVPITINGKEIIRVLYIYYIVELLKKQVKALPDSTSKINAMNPDMSENQAFLSKE